MTAAYTVDAFIPCVQCVLVVVVILIIYGVNKLADLNAVLHGFASPNNMFVPSQSYSHRRRRRRT